MEGPLGEIAMEGAAIESAVEASDASAPARLGQPGAPPGGLPPPGGAGPPEEPGDPEGPRDPEGPGEPAEKEPPKPSARFLTITVVVATLVAALSGFLLNRASAESSDAADMAQQLSLQGSAAETSAFQQAQTDYSVYLSLQSLRAEAAQEMLEAGYDQPGTATWANLFKATTAEAEQTSKSLPSDMHPYFANGDPDPNFPADFFDTRASTGTYMEAKSDAYNDVSNQWTKLVDSYTAIVTMIAVALFLFGSAFVLYGRNRALFTVIGVTLVSVGLIWGGALVLVRQPGAPSDAAAQDYAGGVVAMGAAISPSGYQAAIADFTAAIKERPDYALAYEERSSAEQLRGSEAIGAAFVANVSPYWARLAATDALAAYNLGDHDAGATLNVAVSYYRSWILSGGAGQPPSATVAFVRRTAQLDPTNPVPLLDLGLADLATHQYPAAAKSYAAAMTHMLYTCADPDVLSTCTHPQPSTLYALQQAWFAAAMETLETLASSKDATGSTGMRAAITRMEGVLTGSMASDKVVAGPAPSGLQEEGMSGFIDPNYLGLSVPVPKGVNWRKMADMPLTVLWYQRPDRSSKWSAIPETACWGDGHQECGYYYGGYFNFETRFLTADNSCFTNVQYKAELYIGGSLAGSLSLSPNDDYMSTNLSPAIAKAMNVGTCVPATWRLQPTVRFKFRVYGTSQTVSGPLSTAAMSYASPDHSEGVYLLRLYTPRTSYTGTPADVQDLVTRAAQYAVRLFEGNGLPRDFEPVEAYRPSTLWGYGVTDMMTVPYRSASTGTEALVGAAIIAPGGVVSGAAQQDKFIAAHVDDDYAIVVSIVYARESSGFWSGEHPLGVQVFGSWSLLSYA